MTFLLDQDQEQQEGRQEPTAKEVHLSLQVGQNTGVIVAGGGRRIKVWLTDGGLGVDEVGRANAICATNTCGTY
jgi:hypothetical protein